MSIIRSHDVTLYGGSEVEIVLRPLSDEHLPLLYKWCADPEVLYWTEGGTANENLSYDPETVHHIYGGVSQEGLCFLIEADALPIGECWLQKMNLPNVKAMYPETLDVRRIDMAIGEKAYRGRGIGTQFIKMMVDFAFYGEHVDVLHCFCEDYNIRSRRIWEKTCFKRIHEEALPQPQKGQWQYHYRLTRKEFSEHRRVKIPPESQHMLPITDLQPSQLFVSAGKLRLVHEWFDARNGRRFDPIPVVQIEDRIVITDGHTRALAAHLAGWDRIPVVWDEEVCDPRVYAVNLSWCDNEGVHSIHDLADRIVTHPDYERLWRKRCMEMELEGGTLLEGSDPPCVKSSEK